MHGFLFIHRTSQHHIPGIFIPPDLRVTCVIFAANILILNRWDNGKFAVHIIKIITVFGDYRKLCCGKFIVKTAVDIFGIFLGVINARVDDMQPSVMLNSTSRKAAASVMLFCEKKSNILMLPVNKVGAYGVSPVHSSPLRRIWEILIEKVLFTLVIYKAIWAVYPALRSLQTNNIRHSKPPCSCRKSVFLWM